MLSEKKTAAHNSLISFFIQTYFFTKHNWVSRLFVLEQGK